MYEKYLVRIPTDTDGVTTKTINNTRYVYYVYGKEYLADKKYTKPQNTTIGKCPAGDNERMYPNSNFFRFFGEACIIEFSRCKAHFCYGKF